MKGKLRVNPKIRRMILISGPIIFSLFSIFVYIFLYSPEKDTADYSNIIFVFCASIGLSSQILYGNREMYRASYYFSALSILLPIFIFEVFGLYPYKVYQGRIIILMIIGANLWLILIYKNLRAKNKEMTESKKVAVGH